MKSATKYLIICAVLIIIALIVYFKVYVPKHTFTIIHPTTGQLQVDVQGIGNVNALNIYATTAQSGGKIMKILTDEGQWVKKGQLLIVMDGVDLPQQLEIARANLAGAEYEVKALQGELKSQKAQEELFQLTCDRYKKLNKRGFVAQSEYDKALTDLQGMQATMTATISRIDSSRSAVKAAAKNIDALREKIDRLKVYAPTDGYVIAREAEVAQYVQPSTVILKIVDPKTLWVDVKIDERISDQVKQGQKATIILRSQPGKKYKGVVKRVDAMTDAVTLERALKVAFATIPTPFFINEQARVFIHVRQYDHVIKIPLSVVVQKNGKTGIWIARNHRAHFSAIDKIAVNEAEMAITKGDINTSIIIPNRHKKSLREGMRIYQ